MVKNSVFLGLMFVVLTFLYSGCDDTSTIGFPVADPKIQTLFLDTFTVKTSTVLLDSITTSNTKRILVGEYHDDVFGKTSSSSYFQLASQDLANWIPQSSAIFDSMTLILEYDKYFYGDTTQTQQLIVTELSQHITYRSPNFLSDNISYFYPSAESFNSGVYNKSITSSYSTPIGSVSYKPRPLTGNSVSIRLDDQKGKDWLALATGENPTQLLPANFVENFKGVKISNAPAVNAAVIGFATDSTKLRFYYSEQNEQGILQQKYFDFRVITPELQYNQINSDRTGTPLQNLVTQQNVSSDLTNNETYVHSGAGVLTKIEFPSFKYLNTNDKKFIVLSARLVIMPVNTFDGKKKLPAELGLFEVSNSNIPLGPLGADFDARNIQTARLVQDLEFNRNTGYSFSITEHINNLIERQGLVSSSLLLGIPYQAFTNSVTQARFGNGKNQESRIKLEIYLSRLK